MDREERVKEISAVLMSNIDDFNAWSEGKMSLLTLCNMLAKEVLNFTIICNENNELTSCRTKRLNAPQSTITG